MQRHRHHRAGQITRLRLAKRATKGNPPRRRWRRPRLTRGVLHPRSRRHPQRQRRGSVAVADVKLRGFGCRLRRLGQTLLCSEVKHTLTKGDYFWCGNNHLAAITKMPMTLTVVEVIRAIKTLSER